MSNMPNWLVPEDDRTIPTGALWRQWYTDWRYIGLIRIRNHQSVKWYETRGIQRVV